MISLVMVMILVMSIKPLPFTASGLLAMFLAISMGLTCVNYGIVYFTDSLQPVTYGVSESFWDMIKERTIDRIQLDDSDAIIWESVVGDYFGLMIGRGLGLVHHYAYLFIPPHQLYYMQDNLIPPKSGLSYYVGNAGILGLISITLLASTMAPKIANNRIFMNPNKVKAIKQFQILCLSLWAAHMLRVYTFDITWVLFAIAAIAGFQLHNEAHHKEISL